MRLVYGFGVNDSGYPIVRVINGSLARCKAYDTWKDLIRRCYSEKHQKKLPTYIGVTVCDEWKDNPEAFVKWSLDNGWQKGLHIDKDILSEAKNIHPHVYSPETCQWVTPKKNVGFATNRDNYGKHPNVRLSHEEVAEIIRLYMSGEVTDRTTLMEMFNLKSTSSISRLIKLHMDKVQSSVWIN